MNKTHDILIEKIVKIETRKIPMFNEEFIRNNLKRKTNVELRKILRQYK